VIGLARIAAPIACLGLVVLLVSRTRRNRIAGLGYAAVGAVLLMASLTPPSAAELAAAIAGALVVGALLTWLFRREPWLIAFGTLAFVPLRVHLLGHQLLVPLYLVALGAAGLLLWQLVEGDERAREFGIASWPLALYLGWVGLSVGWTVDLRTAAIDLLAFYLPFTVLALSIARLPWQPSRLRILYGELVVMALGFAAVGFYQYETRNIFSNPKVITANAYAAFFRVNSVFWDPSIYGRFLVVALIPTAVIIVRSRSLRTIGLAMAFAVVAWLGLLISFSQSSFAALLVAVFILSAIVWRWWSLAALATVVLVAGAVAVTQPRVMHVLRRHTISSLNNATSGRASLISNGIKIAVAHPADGVGLGGFEHAYSKRTHRTPRQSASHDTPVTVAAEEGAVGFVLYLWLLVALFRSAFGRLERGPLGRVALAAGLALSAIFVHSLAYNDFFEDPTTWGLFGLIALVAARRMPARAPVRSLEEREPVSEMIPS
jgi:putative inorganic carbon (HCO3(-)) transporter